jgi:hypothetical protein
MRVLTLLAVLAGCAAVDRSGQEELARELSGRAAGATQQCVDTSESGTPVAVDRRTVVLRTADAVWVNRLAADCQGLTPMSTIIAESFAGRYCRNDRIRAVEAGSSTPGPRCRLGAWTPYHTAR